MAFISFQWQFLKVVLTNQTFTASQIIVVNLNLHHTQLHLPIFLCIGPAFTCSYYYLAEGHTYSVFSVLVATVISPVHSGY